MDAEQISAADLTNRILQTGGHGRRARMMEQLAKLDLDTIEDPKLRMVANGFVERHRQYQRGIGR